jgi:hypothetical protein
MKTAFLILACLLGQASAHFDILAALHHGSSGHKKGGFDILAALHGKGHHKKKPAKDDPTGVLGQIMAASAQGLATAEKQHDVAVKAARDDMQSLLQKHVTSLSEAVKKLGTDLFEATAALDEAKVAAHKSLDAAAAKALPAGSNKWDLSPDQLTQARLSTKINFADRFLKKAERRRERSIDEAVSRCDSLLEEDDGVRHLTRKVGDMTELIKTAVAPLDEVGKNVAAEKPANKTSLLQQKGQAMALDKAQENLVAAQKQVDKASDQANKAFDAAFNKVAKDFAAGLKSISDGLDGEQKREILVVRGAAQSVTPKIVSKSAKKIATPKNQLRGKK